MFSFKVTLLTSSTLRKLTFFGVLDGAVEKALLSSRVAQHIRRDFELELDAQLLPDADECFLPETSTFSNTPSMPAFVFLSDLLFASSSVLLLLLEKPLMSPDKFKNAINESKL